MQKYIQNDILSIIFDTELNNVTEIRNKMTGDNYIKAIQGESIFSIWCLDSSDGKKRRYVPSEPVQYQKVCSENSERLELVYSRLFCADSILEVRIKVIIELQTGSREALWSMELENKESALDIVEVLFPHIQGIYLGEDWRDDAVIYPHHAGEKTVNPIETYTSDRFMNYWRANTILQDSVYFREINYCGLASMMWMYYYDKDNGFYISSYDDDFLVTGMRIETGGPDSPWMGFGIRKYIRIKYGECWKSKPYSIAVTCEDWHWGAKTYRKWIDPYIKVDNNPSFLKREYALNQCYNFRRNDGTIQNRFVNIPGMFEKGKEFGMRHMFIASWNRMGFDRHYPEYYPDMELGTSMDLYNGIKYINENGGFATFYINARIFDLDSDYFPTLGQLMAIKKEDGNLINEQYGPVNFAVMCPSDKHWQKHIIDTATWMVKSYNATGIYLDQLASAEPFPCYDEEHSHENIGDFNKGYLHVVKTVKERISDLNRDAFLMVENCGDIYGSYIWGNLTWNGAPYDEHFNVFKYTFPEYVQVNMVNPPKDLTGEERISKFYKLIERAMLLGSVFWLAVTHTFRDGDEELKEYAERAVKLRGKLNDLIMRGRYVDDEGILYVSEGINVSRWVVDEERNLLIIGNIEARSKSFIAIRAASEPYNINITDIDGNCYDARYEYEHGDLKIYISEAKLSYIVIDYVPAIVAR